MIAAGLGNFQGTPPLRNLIHYLSIPPFLRPAPARSRSRSRSRPLSSPSTSTAQKSSVDSCSDHLARPFCYRTPPDVHVARPPPLLLDFASRQFLSASYPTNISQDGRQGVHLPGCRGAQHQEGLVHGHPRQGLRLRKVCRRAPVSFVERRPHTLPEIATRPPPPAPITSTSAPRWAKPG